MPAPSPAAARAPWSDLEVRVALSHQFIDVNFMEAGPDGLSYAARRREGGRDVELRFVQRHAQANDLLERWSRYQLIDHPNVVKLEQVERTDTDWCAVLAARPAHTLGPTPDTSWQGEAGLTLLEQLASALAAAHDVGLWHGQLEPASIGLEGRQARIEFSGVAASSIERKSSWREADAFDDVRALADIAGWLLGGDEAAAAQLPWLARLAQEDPLRRPSAREVCELLARELRDERTRGARRVLETIDTERPLAPRAPSPRPPAKPRPTPTVAARVPRENDRVGRFRLEELLGEGGMGSVFRAVDVASGQVVALKLLKNDLLGDEAVQYRFRKEARVLKAVRSPYIANLIEAEINDTIGYIALEFIDGRDLGVLLAERSAPLEETVALQIVADLCRALSEPHRRGIVHRDIKPQNVLVVGDLDQPLEMSIKLCDFGIASARLTSETLGMTQDGRLWGTPQYMAPEQCRSAEVSPATDVYALGLTLYELCAGRPAFGGDDILQLLRQQMQDQPKDLRQVAAVSNGTATLVARALEKAPDKRFADAGELLAQIEAIRDGGGALATIDSIPGTGRWQEVAFSVDLESTPLELWPLISDTARMNEVVGLPPVGIERIRADGATQTFLSNRVLGIEMRWQEHPFEWIEGRSWSVLRVCQKGVTRWYRVRLDLEGLPSGGTRLTYAMEFEPVFWLFAFIVRFEVGVKQKGKLTRSFRRLDDLIQSGTLAREPSPHASPGAESSQVAEALAAKIGTLRAQRVDEPILRAIEQHVLHAPDGELARIRPLRFARAHGLDERAATEAFLMGTRVGLFNMLWDIICPLCQIASSFSESLEQLGSHSECPACELSFPLDFASSVELVFRVAPEVRSNEVRTYCIGGPSHSPHVAAQLTLPPGEGRVLALELADGRHRVRSPQLPGVIEVDVSARHPFARADLVVGHRLLVVGREPGAINDPRLDMRAPDPGVGLTSGHQTLSLRNQLDREVTLRIERLAGRDDALTAARAWSMPKFREWFPGQTLESGRLVAVGQLSFLVMRVIDHLALIESRGDAVALAETLRAFDQLHSAAEKHDGRLMSSTMDLATAAFERREDAVAAAIQLAKVLAKPELVGSSLALHRGAAVATTINARMEYYGRTLAETLALSAGSRARELVVSSAALGDALEVLAELGPPAAVRPAPHLGPAQWCATVELVETPKLRTAAGLTLASVKPPA